MTKISILTIDYELFLGSKTGTVTECMIGPTDNLLSLLQINNSKMTVFWDILHFYRLLQLEEKFSELKQDRILIEDQISRLIQSGHDVQLHLHPHWLDAVYEDGKWQFKYDRFDIHSLSKENNVKDINTIIGCVTISKKLMEDTIRKVNPNYEVTSFRAGGYLIEPFNDLREALAFNNIYIDSSVAPDMVSNNGIFSYNFSNYPDGTVYNFDDSLTKVNDTGKFIELPITTVKIPAVINLLFTLLRRLKYSNIESKRAGSGSGEINKITKGSNFKKLISLFHSTKMVQFTTDSNFKEKFNYLYKKIPNDSNMILHPKLLNGHTLELLKDYLSESKIKFISIKEFLSTDIFNA